MVPVWLKPANHGFICASDLNIKPKIKYQFTLTKILNNKPILKGDWLNDYRNNNLKIIYFEASFINCGRFDVLLNRRFFEPTDP
jgi:hypothetical protein